MEKINSIRLCCGNKGCPVVTSEDESISIRDDYGNKIIITTEEAKLIGPAVKKLLDK
jgi:hypothetical protein